MQTEGRPRYEFDEQDLHAIMDGIAARRGIRRISSARRCIISGKPFAIGLGDDGAIVQLNVED